jgi:UDP-N-acetylglucosamine--N-acetylmuramyl-(pentapeptide) pyrophosphoryl-undecaprenol N-acetylglucosamine transferase
MRHVLLAGGGTAGHVEPALAVADALRRRFPEVGITMLGTQSGLEARLVPQRGYDLALIPRVPMPRRPSADLVSLPWRLVATVSKVRSILSEHHPDVVVGFGGYVAMPLYLAAKGRVPIVVHEANARAGLANRIGSRWAATVAESVAGSLPHAQLVGVPLRSAIAQLDRTALREEAHRHFGLDPNRPTLLVMGGSQGARRINDAVISATGALVEAGIQVIHAVGPKNEDVIARVSSASHVASAYLDRMDLAYAAADAAVCRSGAMTCAELAAVALPSVLVPYAVGNGEQALNAAPLVRSGGAIMVKDSDFTGEAFCRIVLPLISDAQRIRTMADALTGLGLRHADDVMVNLIEAAAKGGRHD